MKGPFAFGTVYSRNPLTGEKKIFCSLYTENSPQRIDQTVIPKKVLDKIETELKNKEREVGFIVEALIIFDRGYDKYTIKQYISAKIEYTLYPKVLVAFLEEGMINEQELIRKIPLDIISAWFTSQVIDTLGAPKLLEAKSLSPGASIGMIAHSRSDVKHLLSEGLTPIWVIGEVSTEDLKYFSKVGGIVLTQSGVTSHAAIVAKSTGVPTLLGGEVLLDESYKNRLVTIDGNNGLIYGGKTIINGNNKDQYIKQILNIAKRNCGFIIKANADTGYEYKKAQSYLAKGIGLCRTEHMFKDPKRTSQIRTQLFAENKDLRNLDHIQRSQQQDFQNIFDQNDGELIVIRYLDAPLHEFLPHSEKEKDDFAKVLNITRPQIDRIIKKWTEKNPMLGYRAARMLLLNKDFVILQTKAILNAAEKYSQMNNAVLRLGLEIPLVIGANEVKEFKNVINQYIRKKEINKKIKISFGAMIETPLAITNIAEIAKEVDFISYGTNDLVQTYFAISRDDSDTFIESYVEQGFLKVNPFVNISGTEIIEILKQSSEKAKSVNSDIIIGLCGEQGSNPETIQELVNTKIDYLSVSPALVPITYLASAKAFVQ
ncbi:hypothetical protein KC685_01300 [Candidatus Dojkabacteria bacterium]|uniref:Pyruvate, phosphate dikinase n=1 Tax=Candidatus Dojkabacteria bacterium TaxID=2099670 RepID=A0A955I020_9BACT|nr:hypothetical protein [Candidatus Dojkabacteria bacterium]